MGGHPRRCNAQAGGAEDAGAGAKDLGQRAEPAGERGKGVADQSKLRWGVRWGIGIDSTLRRCLSGARDSCHNFTHKNQRPSIFSVVVIAEIIVTQIRRKIL